MSGRRRQYRTRLVRTVQRVVGSALVALLIAGGSISAEESPKNEPSLVLVLSGGGARGIAHIGVIRVLEELQIAPELVIGTSMGSIIGGLYAAGWSAADMQELVEAIDWEDVFTDRVDRQKRSFRRKQDDRPIMIQGRLHFNGLKPVMPSGVIDGQRLELLLRTVEALSPATTDFDELPIPYRAVAADIATGEAVVIGSGSLAEAMRASMSVPGVLPPVAIDGRNLVDGGIAANLPVGIAKELGAQLIIAVDISSPLLKEEGEEFETFMSLYSLGGLLRLSGLGNQELLGEKIAFARLVGYRRLFNFDLAGMKVSIYTGLSLEAGNAYLDEESPAWGNMVKAFSVFIGGDTFVGPVVFAYGRADGNRDRFYLAIGGTF